MPLTPDVRSVSSGGRHAPSATLQTHTPAKADGFCSQQKNPKAMPPGRCCRFGFLAVSRKFRSSHSSSTRGRYRSDRLSPTNQKTRNARMDREEILRDRERSREASLGRWKRGSPRTAENLPFRARFSPQHVRRRERRALPGHLYGAVALSLSVSGGLLLRQNNSII